MAALPKLRKIHWDTLTRARAVENQSYMVALTQTGLLADGSENLGHSMIIDYSGKILSEIEEKEGGIYAEIDLDEMLATLEKRAKENEIAKTEEKEDKKEEPTIIPLVLQKEEAKEEQSELNYEERLAKAKEAFEKLKKDYNKNTKSLNKYRRTERKKARNEKLLNKKAAELASLNLSIYDVKDIKDIDPEKKAKQEDLTKHVAELKSAIVEADEYLEANKEKHLQEVKLNTYLEREYQRYEEELQLAKAEGLTKEVEFTYTEEDKIYADALLIPDSGEGLIKIGQYFNQYTGTHKPILIGTSKWLNSSLYNNSNFNNALFIAPNLDSYAEFEKLYMSVYGNYPIRVSALAYDAVKVAIESYAKAENQEDLRYAIENYQGFNGANGKFRFLSTGLLERRLAIIRIYNGTYEVISYDNEPFLKY